MVNNRFLIYINITNLQVRQIQKITRLTFPLNLQNQFQFVEEYLLLVHPLQVQLDHKNYLQVHKNVPFDPNQIEDNVGKFRNPNTQIRSKHMSFKRARRAESNGKKFLCGLNSEPRYKGSKWSKFEIYIRRRK